LWTVLTGGFTSTVAVSGLLARAAIAGTGFLPLLACATGVLAADTAGPTTAAHHAGALSRRLSAPASSPPARNHPAGCGRGRFVVTPGHGVRLGGWGAGAHRRGPDRRRGPARCLFWAGRAAGAVAWADVRLRRRAAGRPACPAARRTRRCGRRRAHAYRHSARSGRGRGRGDPPGHGGPAQEVVSTGPWASSSSDSVSRSIMPGSCLSKFCGD